MDSMFVSRAFLWYLSEVQNSFHSGDWSKSDEVLDMLSTFQRAKNNVPGFEFRKIDLELRYNKLNVFGRAQVGYLALGGLMMIFSLLLYFGIKPLGGWIIKIAGAGIFAVFLFQTYGIAMRWMIGGYAPFSNSYETMVLLAWTAVFAGLLFARKSRVAFSIATIFAGIILFVSSLNWMDPQITPLVPVLRSPWLMYHVVVLMTAYGFFGVGCLIGLFNLIISRKEKLAGLLRELTIINEIALIIGLILMTVGSFMGAVWANESWGRYWGWDPKETWALITIIVYVMVTHLHLVRKWYSLRLFNLCSVLAFASVLMTYFGVSYFLSGLHSYG
jgi:cytochrome c-type biogenesis protein CcsB